MAKSVALTGNYACAEAMKQINPDVVAAYPITPQTTIMEEFSKFVAAGLVDTEFVTVESEHSAMSTCVGASAAGSRVMTTTSSQGLALMWEVLHIASATRLPIIMHNANRALSAPINIHCDHSDSMGARDCGWIQIYTENAQEAYDYTIQAVRIAEDNRVRLPVMVCLDGFIITHSIARLDLLEDAEVKNFVGEFEPLINLLDPEHPITVGPFDGLQGYFFEFKRAHEEAILGAVRVMEEVGREFSAITGRRYGLLEKFMLDDADMALIVLGSAAGTTREVVKQLRAEGIKAGMIKLRSFRPFPAQEIAAAVKSLKVVGVMDRSMSPGAVGGPVFSEVRSALFDQSPKPEVINFIYGLGGRDVGVGIIREGFNRLQKVIDSGKITETVGYLGLRE